MEVIVTESKAKKFNLRLDHDTAEFLQQCSADMCVSEATVIRSGLNLLKLHKLAAEQGYLIAATNQNTDDILHLNLFTVGSMIKKLSSE